MAERSKLTLDALRRLAREHLGAGYSRLNRSQLVEALRKVVPKLLEAEGEGAAKPSGKKANGKKASEKPLARGVARVKSAIAKIAAKPVEQKPAPKVEAPKVEAPKVEAKREPVPAPLPEAPAKPEAPAAQEAQPAAEQPPEGAPSERPRVIARSTIERAPEVMAAWLRTEREARAQRDAERPHEEERPFPAEPVVEGFFVARVAGRGEARRHHLTDERAAGERAGVQPPTPSGGRLIYLLPRDPATLFVYWDASAAGIDLADGEWLVVRILRGGDTVREIPAAELAHGYYVEGLTPSATYRAEVYAVGPGGERAVDASGLPVSLPHIGEPGERVRFLRVPVGTALPSLPELLRSGRARFVERLGTVLVTVPIKTWRESGGAWAFTLSGSGSGRWLREGVEEAVLEEIAVREWEEAGQPRVELPVERGAPSSLSGAGRAGSPTSGWGRK